MFETSKVRIKTQKGRKGYSCDFDYCNNTMIKGEIRGVYHLRGTYDNYNLCMPCLGELEKEGFGQVELVKLWSGNVRAKNKQGEFLNFPHHQQSEGGNPIPPPLVVPPTKPDYFVNGINVMNLKLTCCECGCEFRFVPVQANMNYEDNLTVKPRCKNFDCRGQSFDVTYQGREVGWFKNSKWTIGENEWSTAALFEKAPKEKDYTQDYNCIVVSKDTTNNTYIIYDLYRERQAVVPRSAILSLAKQPTEQAFGRTKRILSVSKGYVRSIYWEEVVGNPVEANREQTLLELAVLDDRSSSDATLFYDPANYQQAWILNKLFKRIGQEGFCFELPLEKVEIDKWSLEHLVDWVRGVLPQVPAVLFPDIQELLNLRKTSLRAVLTSLIADYRKKLTEELHQQFTLEDLKEMMSLPDNLTDCDYCLGCKVKLTKEKRFQLVCDFCQQHLIADLVTDEELLPERWLPEHLTDPLELIFGKQGIYFENKLIDYNAEYKMNHQELHSCTYCEERFYDPKRLRQHHYRAHWGKPFEHARRQIPQTEPLKRKVRKQKTNQRSSQNNSNLLDFI